MNEKLSRRDFLRVGAVTAAGAALAACQPQVVKETVEVEKVVEQTVEVPVAQTVEVEVEKVVEQTVEVEKVVEVPSEQVTLRFWHHWGGNRIPLMEEQVNRFMAEYPYITVEMTLMPWDNRLQTLLTTIAAGDPVDCTMLGRQDVPSFVVQDALTPLDDFMERDGITADMFYEAEFRGCQYDGKTWILPLPTGGALNLVWRNKLWFEEAGLDPEDPPQTWDVLVEACVAITVLEGGTLEKVCIDARRLSEPGAFLGWLYANGGEWVSEDLRTITFNSQEGLEALQFIVDITNNFNGGVEEVNAFYSQTGEWENGPFYNDFEAIQINGSWEFFKIVEWAPDLIPHLGVSAVPAGPSGDQPGGVAWGGWGYVAPRGVKHPEESWQLVKWLTTAMDGACWFLQQQSRPSPMVVCNEDPASGADNPVWGEILDTMSKDVFAPITPAQPEIQPLFVEIVEQTLYGMMSVEEALEWGAAEAQAILDAFWAEYS